MRKIILPLLAAMCLSLVGCTAVEPENRAFPLIVSMDYQNGNYEVIYGLPDLSKATGQTKTEETGSKDSRTTIYTGATLHEVEQQFDKSQKNYLDLGHMKVLVIGKGLLDDKAALAKGLEFLENTPTVAGNIYVFTSDKIQDLMALNGYEIDSLGDYLVGIIENKPVSDKEHITQLRQMYNAWHNEETIPSLRKIEVNGTQVYLE